MVLALKTLVIAFLTFLFLAGGVGMVGFYAIGAEMPDKTSPHFQMACYLFVLSGLLTFFAYYALGSLTLGPMF